MREFDVVKKGKKAKPVLDEGEKRPAYFWWVLANLFALSFAIVSWQMCLYVFGRPENPRNYRILQKIGRAPVIEDRELLKVPFADSINAVEMYQRFMTMKDRDREEYNVTLLRNYLMNFENRLLMNYVEGTFEVERVRPLTAKDFFGEGFVVQARALVESRDSSKPQHYPVRVEYLFPTENKVAFSWFKPNDLLTIAKIPNCATVLHVAKEKGEAGEVICVTVVPIVFGEYRVGKDRSFRLAVPKEVHPGANFPVFGR